MKSPESCSSLHIDGHGMCTCQAPAISPHTHIVHPKTYHSSVVMPRLEICNLAQNLSVSSSNNTLKIEKNPKGWWEEPPKWPTGKQYAIRSFVSCYWCSRVVVQSHVNKAPPLATEWKKPWTCLVRDQMAFFFFPFKSHPWMIKNQIQILSL